MDPEMVREEYIKLIDNGKIKFYRVAKIMD